MEISSFCARSIYSRSAGTRETTVVNAHVYVTAVGDSGFMGNINGKIGADPHITEILRCARVDHADTQIGIADNDRNERMLYCGFGCDTFQIQVINR